MLGSFATLNYSKVAHAKLSRFLPQIMDHHMYEPGGAEGEPTAVWAKLEAVYNSRAEIYISELDFALTPLKQRAWERVPTYIGSAYNLPLDLLNGQPTCALILPGPR